MRSPRSLYEKLLRCEDDLSTEDALPDRESIHDSRRGDLSVSGITLILDGTAVVSARPEAGGQRPDIPRRPALQGQVRDLKDDDRSYFVGCASSDLGRLSGYGKLVDPHNKDVNRSGPASLLSRDVANNDGATPVVYELYLHNGNRRASAAESDHPYWDRPRFGADIYVYGRVAVGGDGVARRNPQGEQELGYGIPVIF